MDRINVGWLRTFLSVADHGHLGHAAESLQTDQSTVSRKIARLETEVGVPLFERVGRSIRLTPAGDRFVPRAERLIHDVKEAIDDAREAVSAETGEVRVGFLHTVGARWLPERLATFLNVHPGVRFSLAEGTASEVIDGLVHGDFDIGILGPPPARGGDLEIVELFRERISVVVPASHRLATSTSCTLRDIADEPLVLPRSRSGLRKIVDDAFAREGLSVRVAYEGDDFTIVQGLVEAGLGITLLPMPLPMPSNNIIVIPLDPPIARTMALCWDQRRILPPAATMFVQQLLPRATPAAPTPGS